MIPVKKSVAAVLHWSQTFKGVDIMIKRERYMSRIRDNFPKYGVSLDEFNMSRDGIKHMNIRQFLLKPEWT